MPRQELADRRALEALLELAVATAIRGEMRHLQGQPLGGSQVAADLRLVRTIECLLVARQEGTPLLPCQGVAELAVEASEVVEAVRCIEGGT